MLLDTSAWIEYFKGTEKGETVLKLITRESTIYTCPLTFAELTFWCHKNKQKPEPVIEKINQLSKTLDLTEEILVKSGEIYYWERQHNDKISMIDCIIYTCAKTHNLKLLTKDRDFESLSDVEML